MSEQGKVELKPKRARAGIRTKRATTPEDDEPSTSGAGGEEQQDSAEVQRCRMEEIRLLHKLRRKAGGTNAQVLMEGGRDELHQPPAAPLPKTEDDRNELLGTFSRAEMRETTEEDPNMQSFIEAELAKRLGRNRGETGGPAPGPEGAEAKRKRLESELYQVPAELQTDMGGKDVVIPGMNMVITEVPTSASVRINNIEETEAMKRKMLGGPVERDPKLESKATAIKRNEFVTTFGKQNKKPRDPDVDRDLAEENNKRMRFVSERKPAISTAKEQKLRR
mmetsp:Transcript_26398/g.71372  ORF Transcript_26398/g.71372 Transcript_26398/m.71372 type:complete len:279 (+) Transcript_26398:124-960(+)|eukprot:CAMPEP_0202346416 /NCGR_PEP_ID=MMETSP1126-20121109/5215_1 /ASSEMBLY_ACC=CAM_ASM_000457 /TAXON_ID=3047 /ORGANISM="Dunaliella tertiolecta, Strain CCMP1320" /LENGTH=278 /DNA_ID=CAMNT_0048937819 /DNA_START=130 /DNA_END=966 /DNA_ORIENTATION=+